MVGAVVTGRMVLVNGVEVDKVLGTTVVVWKGVLVIIACNERAVITNVIHYQSQLQIARR